MKKISKTIVFFGTENLSDIPLERLIEGDYDVAAVVTKPDAPKGRKRKLTPPSVKIIANNHGIKVLQPEKLGEIADFIASFDEPPVGILASYGKIIPQRIIDLFAPGIINIHPSLLPEYRGPSPIETTILDGKSETGVSIMKLVKEMDAGPVYAQRRIGLRGNESKQDLYNTLSEIGVDLLIDNLPNILDGTMEPIPQDDDKTTFCEKFDKSMSLLNCSDMTALECYNQVRAFAGFPKSKLMINGVECTITSAAASNTKETEIDRRCKDGNYLVIRRLIPCGGKEITAVEFVNGYQNRL
jgi:methionyl-tRNA formyltransferase